MATHFLIQQTEEALLDPKLLDRDLVHQLVQLTKALEIALVEACRSNLELRTMDRNVSLAANALKSSIEALNRAYTEDVQVDENELERTTEAYIAAAKASL